MNMGAEADCDRSIPVILDTDIGYDIDDTWALAMLLRSPELDPKLVVSGAENTAYSARIIARMLEMAGESEVPVGVGLHKSDHVGRQLDWVADYELESYPGTVHRDGVDALVAAIMCSPEPVTLLCIGPLSNIGEALRREPRIAERARFVGMHGSIRRGYLLDPEIQSEHNVVRHTKDSQKVFTAPWEMTITPMDTCGWVRLQGEKYRKVRESQDPLAKAVIENYQLWASKLGREQEFEKQSSILFDTVAIYLAFSDRLLNMEKLGVRVTDDGYTVIDDKAKVINCANSWKDLPAFESFLVRRLTGE